MMFPKVAVVILNWNGKNYLQQFLPSVVASTYQNLEIIVGDNFSTDDSVEYLTSNYPDIKIIRNNKNYGFAEGYNKVLFAIEADYFILLNSDVEVTPNWVEPVIEMMETDNSIAAAQPKLLSYQDKTKFEYAGAAGGFLDKYGYPFCRGRIFDTVEVDDNQFNEATEIFWASGAALFIKTKFWKEAGGLDGDFFAHMEEIDLCWRLKNIGYKIMYCPSSTVYHLGGGTLAAENPFKTYLNFRNNLFMLQKNLPESKAFLIIFIRFWLDFISLIKYVLDGKFKNALAISKAHFSFIKRLRSTNSKRLNQTAAYDSSGFYEKSIVWQYFIKKKKTFGDLGL